MSFSVIGEVIASAGACCFPSLSLYILASEKAKGHKDSDERVCKLHLSSRVFSRLFLSLSPRSSENLLFN